MPRKKNTEEYVVVPVTRPTFAMSVTGSFYRIDHFVEHFLDGDPVQTFFVTDKGECRVVNGLVAVFNSPLRQDEYKYLCNIAVMWKSFTRERFDDYCNKYQVEIKD